jgi:hypothetical protein
LNVILQLLLETLFKQSCSAGGNVHSSEAESCSDADENNTYEKNKDMDKEEEVSKLRKYGVVNRK